MVLYKPHGHTFTSILSFRMDSMPSEPFVICLFTHLSLQSLATINLSAAFMFTPFSECPIVGIRPQPFQIELFQLVCDYDLFRVFLWSDDSLFLITDFYPIVWMKHCSFTKALLACLYIWAIKTSCQYLHSFFYMCAIFMFFGVNIKKND